METKKNTFGDTKNSNLLCLTMIPRLNVKNNETNLNLKNDIDSSR